jgi:Activator of Hsp90 ATPase homolog 1-like protein
MSEAAATASVEVPLGPEVAFEAFTSEIDRWWRPGPLNWYDSERATGTKIEPGVGGRWLELYDADGNDLLEIARITVWEPGIRIVMDYLDGGYDNAGTEVEVRFDPVEGGTRSTIEHRG